MSLSPNQAFKAGFLARCVEDRLSLSETQEAAEKAAAVLEKQALSIPGAETATGLAKWVGDKAFSYGLPFAALAPPVLGGAAGYGLARLTDIDDTDVEDIKDQEVLDEYQRQTAKLNRNRVRAGR